MGAGPGRARPAGGRDRHGAGGDDRPERDPAAQFPDREAQRLEPRDTIERMRRREREPEDDEPPGVVDRHDPFQRLGQVPVARALMEDRRRAPVLQVR